MDEPPLIDIAPLIDDRVLPTARAPKHPHDRTTDRRGPGHRTPDRLGDTATGPQRRVAEALDAACRNNGFFRVTGHGIDPALFADLDRQARRFFAQNDEAKAEVAMAKAGPAWRGWFPVGAELTSGRPDRKEGIYFGTELPEDDPRVLSGTPLHGPNLFPDQPANLGPTVLTYLDEVTRVGHAVMSGLAIALGLPPGWFAADLTADPTVLFRIFHYPPEDGPPPVNPAPDDPIRCDPSRGGPPGGDPTGDDPTGDDPTGDNPSDGRAAAPAWGVAEHTDYGLLTLLAQDDRGGLEVRVDDRWVPVPAEPGVLVCNLGDMLEALTAGRYRSTLHRVRNTSGAGRLSFPVFFDPGWDARVRPLPIEPGAPSATGDRWDGADPTAWAGTYGEYLTAKVSRVFPELSASLEG